MARRRWTTVRRCGCWTGAAQGAVLTAATPGPAAPLQAVRIVCRLPGEVVAHGCWLGATPPVTATWPCSRLALFSWPRGRPGQRRATVINQVGDGLHCSRAALGATSGGRAALVPRYFLVRRVTYAVVAASSRPRTAALLSSRRAALLPPYCALAVWWALLALRRSTGATARAAWEMTDEGLFVPDGAHRVATCGGGGPAAGRLTAPCYVVAPRYCSPSGRATRAWRQPAGAAAPSGLRSMLRAAQQAQALGRVAICWRARPSCAGPRPEITQQVVFQHRLFRW